MADNVKNASSDTKPATKSPLTLDKLPVDVLEEVTGWLSLVDCLALRKVSRDLQSFVDSTERHCEELSFVFKGGSVTMLLDALELTYEETGDRGCKVIWNRKLIRGNKAYRDGRNFKQVMLADAITFLGNPKLEIDRVVFVGDDAETLEFFRFLKSLNFRLNVKSIRSSDLDLLHSIQEFLKPEKLEQIVYSRFDRVLEFNEIAKTNMDIVKNPKLKLETIAFDNYSDESSAKFSETLKSINSQLNIQIVHVADGRWIPTILQSVNLEKMEKMIINQFGNLTVDQFNAIAREKQWKTKTKMQWVVPEGIGLEQLVDFKEFRCHGLEFTEENLVKIRDILLKSPHLDWFKLESNRIRLSEGEMYERFDRIMSQNSAYDVGTRRMSIPDSPDYFQLELKDNWSYIYLTIKRISAK